MTNFKLLFPPNLFNNPVLEITGVCNRLTTNDTTCNVLYVGWPRVTKNAAYCSWDEARAEGKKKFARKG
jgi:hypothetical protein